MSHRPANKPTESDLERFDRSDWARVLLWTPKNSLNRAHMVAFSIGSLSHLWLGDAWQWGWLPYNILYLLGLVAMWRLGTIPIAWALCMFGLMGPLLFQRDQLTQSMLLLLMTAIMLAGTWWDAKRRAEAHHGYQVAIISWRSMTVGTYMLAAIHKINRDFFNTTLSCSTYGWHKVVDYWRIPSPLPEPLLEVMPWAIIATESAIALGLLFGLRRWVWPLAVAFHIPLTVTMAPAFAFVMLVGHASFLTRDDLTFYAKILKDRGWALGIFSAICTGLSLWSHGRLPELSMIPKEWLLWMIGWVTVLGLWRQPGGDRRPWVRATPVISVAALIIYLAHGLTPYTGLQFQHTGAMLSNLRIDRGCWNSCIFPESMRIRDDYVRVEEAILGKVGHRPKYERMLTDRLWSPPQFLQMQINWCTPDNRPFYVRGDYRGKPFVIKDICDTNTPHPFAAASGVFTLNLAPNYLRFQKNLARKCPQSCIH